MSYFWFSLRNSLSFTGINDVIVWQDAIIGSLIVVLLIPLTWTIVKKLENFFYKTRPLILLLDGYIGKNILVFLSQLNALNDRGNLDPNPAYIIQYPSPTPRNTFARGVAPRVNIDPVWSQGDGECFADVYNVVGRAGKVESIQIGNLINDWNEFSKPIFSIGFSPKTADLQNKCKPIYYTLNAHLKIKGSRKILNAFIPNDAAIIQKTFIKNTNVPVFILAGLGVTGTSAAGYFFKDNCADFGKLYGNKAFCVLLHVDSSLGRQSVSIKAAYPKPSNINKLFHFLTYYKYSKMKIFPKK